MRRCLHIWSALAALLFGFSGDAHFGIRASQQGVRVELTPRLRKVTERDSARNGQDWTGVFDAFGRRLQTTQIVVAKSAALTNSPIIVSHYFDPAVEFLELRVTEGDRTTWKMMGPDANGVYGEMNGTGGFEAIIPGPDLFCPIVSDFRGNVLAVFDGIHNGLLWNSNRVGGFGGVPGYRPMTAGTGGSQTSLAGETAWRNRMTESVGYVWLGANIYDPSSGRFLSFDARGHAASPSGYEFCGGDPINYFDADGRLGVRAGKWAENTYENGVQMFEGLLNPETRLQTVKDGAYGSARGAFNWAVESAQGVNNVVPGSPLGGYLNNQALSYVSGEGNQLINSAGGAYGADPNSPATQTWDSLTRGVLTAGSILYTSAETSGGGGAAKGTVGDLLAGHSGDTMIHLTTATEQELATATFPHFTPPHTTPGVFQGSSWVKLEDVAHMTLAEYQELVVGPVAAGYGNDVSAFVTHPPSSVFTPVNVPNLGGVQEFINGSVVKPGAYVPIAGKP